MKKILYIQNLKCEGCEQTIIKNMVDIPGVEGVRLSVPKSEIQLIVDSELTLEKAIQKLSKLGYPILGARNTFAKKASSYASCFMGKYVE